MSERSERRSLLGELASPREYLRLRASPVYAGEGVPRGAGEPVLLLPGFLVDDGSLAVLARWLRRAGYRTHRSHLGRNVGCAERALRRLERRLVQLAGEEGRRVALVGHSRGGHFARVLAVRHPELVAGVVTLSAPPMDPRAVHPLVAAPAVAVTLLGTLGMPGWMRSSCYVGDCCRRFRTQLAGPFPPDVPFTAIYSKSDAIVDWHRLSEPAAERVEVPASHLGIVVNPFAYAALGAALERFRA